MNLQPKPKKSGEALARVPAIMPGLCSGEGPGKAFTLNHRPPRAGKRAYLAATAVLTSMAVSFTVPVTVAFLPAC